MVLPENCANNRLTTHSLYFELQENFKMTKDFLTVSKTKDGSGQI